MILNNKNIPDNVANSILSAADLVGVDKGFMLAMANQERSGHGKFGRRHVKSRWPFQSVPQ